jgi:hypothetical protein
MRSRRGIAISVVDRTDLREHTTKDAWRNMARTVSPMTRLARFLSISCMVLAAPAGAMAENADASQILKSRGEPFCFGRSYPANHMARHKRQTLAALFIFKDFSPDPLSEDKPVAPERLIADDKGAGDIAFSVLRHYRDGRMAHFPNRCEASRDGGVECPATSEMVEFELNLRADGGGVIARDGLDRDTSYRLERLPLNTCLKWRDRARPPWVGKSLPLRVRFAQRAPVCFGLDRDARYLAQHPGDKIASALLRINRPTEIDPNDKVTFTMLRITASIKLRDGTVSLRHARCDGAEYAFWCQYRDGAIRLKPADERGITLYDQKDPETPREKTEMEAFFGLSLGGRNQTMQLTERDDAQCELR